MKKFLFFAVVAALFSACAQDVVVETLPAVVDDAPSAITLDLESEDTRIQLNEAQKTVWTNGDKVSVFYRSDANQKWAYNGPTGSRTAEIHRVDSGQSLPEVFHRRFRVCLLHEQAVEKLLFPVRALKKALYGNLRVGEHDQHMVPV